MPSRVDTDSKISVLSYIRDEKDILLGKFSDTVTAVEKNKKWDEIAARAKSIGALTADKDGNYLRTTTWQNWRKRAMIKRDNMRKTGTSGGKKNRLDPADEMVFEIIGVESPVLDGLNIPESSGNDSSEAHFDAENDQSTSSGTTSAVPEDLEEGYAAAPQNESRRKPGPKPGHSQKMQEFNDLKALKIQAQMDLIKREERIKDLEILRREKDLGLAPSEYTQKFYQPQEIVVVMEDSSSH